MPRPKIDKIKLHRMVTAGKSQKEVAQVFGVTEAAISKAMKGLNIAVVKNVALENAHKVVGKSLNAIDQLQKINIHANAILDSLMCLQRGEAILKGKDPRELALKAMQEIRGQLGLQLEIFKTLYDLEAIAEFQTEVLSAIEEVSPDVRNSIVNALKKRRTVRQAISFD